MKVKPAQGLKVRDPRTMNFIPAEGFELREGENTTYWTRRIKTGDVLVVEGESQAEAPAPALAENEKGGE